MIKEAPMDDVTLSYLSEVMSHLMVPYILSEVMSYLMAAGAFYLAWRFVRAYERRVTAADHVSSLSARVGLLEESFGEIEARVADTNEAQRFAAELFLSKELPRR
jgi:hypothetical protein